MEPTIIQLAIDSIWNTIQSKELYMIVVVILVLYVMKPWKKKQNEEVYGQQEQEERQQQPDVPVLGLLPRRENP